MKNGNLQWRRLLMTPVLLALTSLNIMALDETLVKITDDSRYAYSKPETSISPSGAVYIAYTAKALSSGRGDIFLSKYEGGKVSFVKNVSENAADSYESDMFMEKNGKIHVAWCDHNFDRTHIIRYRKFDGLAWSAVQTLGQVSNTENIEDLRIAADPAGNVFVVFMNWPAANCYLASKYGNDTTFEKFPHNSRSKHPDVAADSNYVHVTWQFRPDSDYTIAYQRRPNRKNSAWDRWIDLDFKGTQRPRISLDQNLVPHIVFFQNFGGTRTLWYKKWTGARFDAPVRMSDPAGADTYHFCNIQAVNANYILVSMQRGGWGGGRNISYNWRQDGKWTGFSFFPKTYGHNPTKFDVSLSVEHQLAAIGFAEKNAAVYVDIVKAGTTPIGTAPTARFSYSPQTGAAPLTVNFDGSTSSDNDGTITQYNWNFGDGLTGAGPQIQHVYQTQGTFTATLTVIDNDGKNNSTSHQLVVEPPNIPPTARFTANPSKGLYPLTVTLDASSSYDNDGEIIRYDWEVEDEEIPDGKTIQHTFTEEGLFKVTLIITDNRGASASTSTQINVLGILPPLNTKIEYTINRNLFTIQHVTKLTWDNNPANPERGANIIQYKIYRKPKSENGWSLFDTVTAQNTNLYYDRLGKTRIEYDYTITSIDAAGRESQPPSTNPPPSPIQKIPSH